MPDAIDENNPTPGKKSRPPSGSGGSVTDPHLTTFDGARHPMMAVGEFDMLVTDGVRVQLRTEPWSSNDRVSVNSAAAIDVHGDTVVIDAERGAPEVIVIGGSEVPISQSEGITLAHGGQIFRRGNAIEVSWPDGRAVIAGIYFKGLDLYVTMSDDFPPFTGLLGNYDEDSDNDFFVGDGDRPADLTDEAFYGEVVESFFDDCVTDVGATGNLGFVTRLVDTQGVHRPGELNFTDFSGPETVFVEGAKLADFPVLSDQAGNALVSLNGDNGPELVALSTRKADVDGATPVDTTAPDAGMAWRILIDNKCGVAIGGTSALDDNGIASGGGRWIAVPFIDQVDEGGSHLVGINAASGNVAYEQRIDGMFAGPVTAGDDSVWVVAATDENLAAHRVDPDTGVAWQADFPVALGGKKYSAPSRLAVDDAAVVGYSGSSILISMDAATGKVRGRIQPSTFNNNGGHVALHNGAAVVGPIGGRHWVEGYDVTERTLIFALQPPPGPHLNDVKRIDSLGPEGLVLQANVDDKDHAPG